MQRNFTFTILLFLLIAPISLSAQTSSFTKPSITQHTEKFATGGKSYTMYWVNISKVYDPSSVNVMDVYFVPSDFVPFNKYHESTDRNCPPRLIGLVYHDLGTGKEFVGAIVTEKKYFEHTKQVELWEYEIKLPERISDLLMDLYKDRTKFRIGKKGRIAKIFENLETVQTPEIKKPTLTKRAQM